MSSPGRESQLDSSERRLLLRLARRAIAAALAGESARPDAASLPEALRVPAAVFVSLHLRGELRGCIGSLAPEAPLAEAVADNACLAAFEDPRFAPLTPAELPRLAIEISVLSPFEPCDPEEIVIGRDGLMIRRGARSGVFLPQVAVEWGWSRDEYLERLCQKGNLPPGEWSRPGVILERFTAEVFSETTDG
ncbi:MAG: AmmeMemoRadiSam system protein A [Thermoanaerobaculia bacterium]